MGQDSPSPSGDHPPHHAPPPPGTPYQRLKRFVFGAPRDVEDPHTYHSMSLIALLAWVGLGADGLSSSSYGPDEAFRALGDHRALAIFLALATGVTVLIISVAYSQIIKHFPFGGGGYVVASQLLGPRAGVVSGSALLVDYVLTISVSIASGGDAIFSFVPPAVARLEAVGRGAGHRPAGGAQPARREGVGLDPGAHLRPLPPHPRHPHRRRHRLRTSARCRQVASEVATEPAGLPRPSSGPVGLVGRLHRAYSMGAGTYTGIEAVSNGLQIMREPKVQDGAADHDLHGDLAVAHRRRHPAPATCSSTWRRWRGRP